MANDSGRPTLPVVLGPEGREYLGRQVRRRRVSRSISERCRIILRCADGIQSKVVAGKLGLHEHTVGKCRRRFLQDPLEALLDEARQGRPRTMEDDQVAAVVSEHCVQSLMTRFAGRSALCRAQPTFHIRRSRASGRLSGFSHIVQRRSAVERSAVRRQGSRYRRPLSIAAHRALVLSVDEKGQIQPLDREPPILPMMLACPSISRAAMSAMAPPRSSRRSISPRALSSANAASSIAPLRFSTSSSSFMRSCRQSGGHIIMDN